MDITAIDRKTVIKGVVILVIAIALYFGVRKVIRTIQSDSAANIKDAEIKSNQLSYPLTMYSSLADQVESAFTLLTTNEQNVYSIFKKMNTLSDVLQLNRSFGTRTAPGINFGQVSLSAFLQKGMSAQELAEVNKILKTNSINFSF